MVLFYGILSSKVAEREGFEPSVRFPVRRFSKPVLSATQPPLQSSIALRISKIMRQAISSNAEMKYFAIFLVKITICRSGTTLLREVCNLVRFFCPGNQAKSSILDAR